MLNYLIFRPLPTIALYTANDFVDWGKSLLCANDFKLLMMLAIMFLI